MCFYVVDLYLDWFDQVFMLSLTTFGKTWYFCYFRFILLSEIIDFVNTQNKELTLCISFCCAISFLEYFQLFEDIHITKVTPSDVAYEGHQMWFESRYVIIIWLVWGKLDIFFLIIHQVIDVNMQLYFARFDEVKFVSMVTLCIQDVSKQKRQKR